MAIHLLYVYLGFEIQKFLKKLEKFARFPYIAMGLGKLGYRAVTRFTDR
jgi:hypothetical protein